MCPGLLPGHSAGVLLPNAGCSHGLADLLACRRDGSAQLTCSLCFLYSSGARPVLNEMTHLLLLQALPYVCLLIAMLFFIYAIIGMQVSTDISVCISLAQTGWTSMSSALCTAASLVLARHCFTQSRCPGRFRGWNSLFGSFRATCPGGAAMGLFSQAPQLPSQLVPLEMWPWGLSWARCVVAAFKSPPLCLEVTPYLQLPSSPQRLISCLRDLVNSILPFPSEWLDHSGDPCSPPCPSVECLCCSHAADGLLGLPCLETCNDLSDGGRSAEHGKM